MAEAMSDGKGERDDRAERRRRRLEARRRLYDTSIPSPCISVCQIGPDDRCIGCYRSIDEIRDWPIMTAEEKTATLARIAARKSATASS